MERVEWKTLVWEYGKKYRYVFLILLIGAFLMLMPDTSESDTDPQPKSLSTPCTLQEELTTILSKIEGAGNTSVLLTELAGRQTHYQSNENMSTNEHGKEQQKETVLVTNSSREETGLIRRIDPPIYQGAIILCQGAANAQVRLSIVEAVSNATGLSTDKITVLKMK